jgi:hypothetical protein
MKNTTLKLPYHPAVPSPGSIEAMIDTRSAPQLVAGIFSISAPVNLVV